MKKLFFVLTLIGAVVFSNTANAQSAKTVKLEQTPGEFNKTSLKLKAGKTYVFQVKNKGVDHKVGFVVAPKNDTDAHIKNAYLKETIEDGQTAQSNEVVLEAGEYVFFCPLNPTPQYTIVVE